MVERFTKSRLFRAGSSRWNTTVYFRKTRSLKKSRCPTLPVQEPLEGRGTSCQNSRDHNLTPQKWLSSDTLVLRVNLADLMEKGGKQLTDLRPNCYGRVRFEFAEASIQSAKQVKSIKK